MPAAPDVASLMRGLVEQPVSIVSVAGMNLLPCLFSAAAVVFSAPWLLFLICFGKAFLFAYGSVCLASAFGSAGWLVWILAFFGDLLLLPLLYFFWLRALHRGGSLGLCLMLLAGCIGLCSLEISVLAPFLASLFHGS